MNTFGKSRSSSWGEFIHEGRSSRDEQPEKEAISNIMICLRKGVSRDKTIDGFMKKYFDTKLGPRKPIEYTGPKGCDKKVIEKYEVWKRGGTGGNSLRDQVMDNAAPLGKWPDLFLNVKRPNYVTRALDAAGSATIDAKLNDKDGITIYNIMDEADNYIKLTYTDGDKVSMTIEVKLSDKLLTSTFSTTKQDLALKPLSVKAVIRRLFEKVHELTHGGGTQGGVSQMLDNTRSMVITDSMDVFFQKHILPIVMHKLSGDLGQEVSACGGVVRGDNAIPIAQVHNDIPAFLRGLLLSSQASRDGTYQTAPVIYQTAHSGRYWDAEPS